jgi:hypothetical protein
MSAAAATAVSSQCSRRRAVYIVGVIASTAAWDSLLYTTYTNMSSNCSCNSTMRISHQAFREFTVTKVSYLY